MAIPGHAQGRLKSPPRGLGRSRLRPPSAPPVPGGPAAPCPKELAEVGWATQVREPPEATPQGSPSAPESPAPQEIPSLSFRSCLGSSARGPSVPHEGSPAVLQGLLRELLTGRLRGPAAPEGSLSASGGLSLPHSAPQRLRGPQVSQGAPPAHTGTPVCPCGFPRASGLPQRLAAPAPQPRHRPWGSGAPPGAPVPHGAAL